MSETNVNGAAAGAGKVEVTVESLGGELAVERAKNEVLLKEVVTLEEELANRDLEEFAGVISDQSREYWRGQLLTNRKAAKSVLAELAAGKAAAPAVVHNRATARPVIPGAAGEPAAANKGAAARIRNRAQEIVAAERVPFSAAFKRAEQEMAG